MVVLVKLVYLGLGVVQKQPAIEFTIQLLFQFLIQLIIQRLNRQCHHHFILSKKQPKEWFSSSKSAKTKLYGPIRDCFCPSPGPPKIRPWSMLWSISKCESIKTTMFWKQLHLIWYLLIQVRHLLMAFLLKQRPLATHSSKQHQNLITCILTHHHHQVIFTIMTHNSWVINSGWYLKLIQIRFTKWSPRRYLSQVW